MSFKAVHERVKEIASGLRNLGLRRFVFSSFTFCVFADYSILRGSTVGMWAKVLANILLSVPQSLPFPSEFPALDAH